MIIDPPCSDQHLARQRLIDAMPVYVPPRETVPPWHLTARQIEERTLIGESVAEGVARRLAEQKLSMLLPVALEPRNHYSSHRLGDD